MNGSVLKCRYGCEHGEQAPVKMAAHYNREHHDQYVKDREAKRDRRIAKIAAAEPVQSHDAEATLIGKIADAITEANLEAEADIRVIDYIETRFGRSGYATAEEPAHEE